MADVSDTEQPPPTQAEEETEESPWSATFELASPDGTELRVSVEGADDGVAEVIHAGLASYLHRRHAAVRPRVHPALAALTRLGNAMAQALYVAAQEAREDDSSAPSDERLQ